MCDTGYAPGDEVFMPDPNDPRNRYFYHHINWKYVSIGHISVICEQPYPHHVLLTAFRTVAHLLSECDDRNTESVFQYS